MSTLLTRISKLAVEINNFGLGNCSPSDDPDMQTAYVFAYKDLIKRFLASAKRIENSQLQNMLSSIDPDVDTIYEAYNLRSEIQGVLDFLEDYQAKSVLKEKSKISPQTANSLSVLIVECLRTESATYLAEICKGYGLSEGTASEAFQSKANYVKSRIIHFSPEQIFELAKKLKGKYYYYYKCRFSKHNNISAKKAHEQLEEAFGLMSLKPSMVAKIRERSQLEMEKSHHSNKEQLKAKKEKLRSQEQKLHALEEKWISDAISKDTYDRWYYVFKDSCLNLEAAIERLSMDYSYGYKLLDKNLDKLTDLKHFYKISEIEDKQQLVNQVFDSNLYYKAGIYRTPTMMGVFTHNTQKMREKGLLIYEKEREGNDTFSFSGE